MYSNNTYIAQPGSLAQFTVRNAGTVDAADWRLIEWRDLGRNSLVARAIGQATTWGGVKSLYW